MSKLWKGVKKVFKKVTKFVKKHWKVIAIAAVIYFSAGIALAAMPSTAAFSAAMPGFGVGGIFSNAAVALGATGAAGSGIAGTVAAQAAAAAGTAATTAAVAGGTINLPATGAAAKAAATGAVASGTATGVTAASVAAPASTAVSAMSGLEKVALASTVFKGVGGLLSDSENDVNRKQHNREYGQSFGVGRDGTGPGFKGLVSGAFGDKYAQKEQENPENVTPFDASQAQAQPATPFDSGPTELAQQTAPQKAAINQGYKNKDYRPI